jgi:UDP-N-acetylglucosamine--dolichyl-phosphate N-acetylglucosaminephosphotransferase
MTVNNNILAMLPLVPSAVMLYFVPIAHDEKNLVVKYWIYASLLLSILGYFLVSSLVKVVAEYNIKARLSGKDLGKKGTDRESVDVPEALGIVPGLVFLICTITSQLLFANSDSEKVIFNSALFSICFMIFLGFTDDVLDLKWRYKLILPTLASLPLLSSYGGSTAMFLPHGFLRTFLWNSESDSLTVFGSIVNLVATVDKEAKGGLVELGWLFLVYMGLLAVFCTNSINIYAGINGLEAGQAYIIAASILFFKLYELAFYGDALHINEVYSCTNRQIFAILIVLPFIGTTMGLLKHNWYPAKVFVGDTYCYFAGMTFAVLGIHGHFSKTILLLLLPQVYNFIVSMPQVFKFVECPRHRLPRFDPVTNTMHCSTFGCKKEQYRWIKLEKDAEECPNFTIICTILRIFGPMSEKKLTIFLLCIQSITSILAFTLRYVVYEIPVP